MNFINKIIYLFKGFAWFKRLNAKITYELLAKHIPATDWQFMNYGYAPMPSEQPLILNDYQTEQQYPLQMYHYLASKAQLEGKQVLEVGSGRGGGAAYLAKCFNPAFYTGLDLASSAVTLANKLYQYTNLNFIQGSAEAIPLQDKSIDVVINVESSHAYGDVVKFLSEVKRVLRPGGYFLMVDFRNSQENMTILKSQLSTCGMELITEENINANVLQAIEAENDKKVARIEKLIAPKYQKLFCDFAGVVGSPFHTTLKNGTRQYERFVLRKNI